MNYVVYLDIEKDNRPQRWVADRVKKNPLLTRESRGAVFLIVAHKFKTCNAMNYVVY